MAQRTRGVQLAAQKLSSQFMVALLIVALIGFLGLFLWQSLQIQKMESDYHKKQAELVALQERNDRLQEHLDFYKGPGYLLYVEKVAREALGLVKPGETVVLTVPDKGTSGNAVSNTTNGNSVSGIVASNEKKKPNWRNWLDFFVGH